MATPMSPKDLHTTFPYLARDAIYQKERPYATAFLPESNDVVLTNHIFDFMDLVVRDAQPLRESFNLQTQGFCFFKASTSLSSHNVDDERFVEKTYFDEIEALLHEKFPEYTRLECLDYQLRRRSSLFPTQPGAVVTSTQPAVLPHSDFSQHGGFLGMDMYFPGQEKYYSDRDFDLLNVWRVIKGPNNDWPLALCDYQSIDFAADVLPNDLLYINHVGENELLHKASGHAWYYLSDQTVEDLIVFRNTDSRGVRPRCFHAAFDAKMSTSPRESIEVRVAAFR